MRKIFLVALAPLALCGCGALGALTGIPSAPAVVAEQTVLDEQGALAVELAYKAVRLAVETGVDAELIKGQRAAQIAELDNKAYAAVLVARRAYRAGNATSYGAALAEAREAITQLIALFN
jgi:hypothetical protein